MPAGIADLRLRIESATGVHENVRPRSTFFPRNWYVCGIIQNHDKVDQKRGTQIACVSLGNLLILKAAKTLAVVACPELRQGWLNKVSRIATYSGESAETRPILQTLVLFEKARNCDRGALYERP